MSFKPALSLFFLASSVLSASICPTYSCDPTMASNTCAVYVGSYAFKVNSNGCVSGYTCSAVTVATWAQAIFANSQASNNNAQECVVPITTSVTTTYTYQSTPCPTKLPNKTFKSGQTVPTCLQDDDCLLTDGTKTVCVCSFRTDGLGMCTADYSNDQVFGAFWSACGSTNVITDEKAALYWTAYMANWVYEQGTISCMGVFAEVQEVQSLYANYNSAEVLAVVMLGLLS